MNQIKRLAASKSAPANSYSNVSTKVPFKKKARDGVLPARNQQVNKNPNHKGYQHYCVLCTKDEMHKRKYKFHSS